MISSSERITTLLEQLNSPQREAVTATEGPVLVVAGAGSGKTRVITYRVAYLLLSGVAESSHMIALTFTNKAAGEMKSRVAALAGSEFKAPLISTFHSFGALFLRKHIELLGRSRGFLIYDEDDQLEVIEECCGELNLPENRYQARDLQYFLKWQKSRAVPQESFDANVAGLLRLYTMKLQTANAVDFEDLLTLPLQILREYPDVSDRYRQQYRYWMVDEYQDTNEIQYELLKALAGERPNLLVVGDEDQSIYRFRGARSENIQYFIRDFPDVKIVKLEQNYRSTKTIIKAAQSVISQNNIRIKKQLWTENAAGEPVEIYHAFDEYDEATLVTLRVMSALKEIPPAEIAVVYRTNAQSRVLEESFAKAQIPHRIVGGVGFYERREVRDVVAFLRVLVNRNDSVSFLRIVNVPPRGVGKKLLQQIQTEAAQNQINLFEAAKHVGGRSLSVFLDFFESPSPGSSSTFLENLLARIGYAEYLKKEDTQSAEERLENIAEFLSFLRQSETETDFDLTTFLSELPLQSKTEDSADAVTLLTVHSAKGLEFRLLFVVGMEEGLFPHIRSLDKNEDVEEERRLFYVAMTRAKEKLNLSWAQRRGIYGSQAGSRPSRFLEEIPPWFKVIRISERLRAPVRAQTAETQDPACEFRVGGSVWHEKFGKGIVMKVEGVPNDWKLTIRFDTGVKTILTRYAKLVVGR